MDARESHCGLLGGVPTGLSLAIGMSETGPMA
jgi:hypothetical protein